MTPLDFASVRGLLFDMDGVWFVGGRAIDGAAETLAGIRDRGIPVRFITNTTTMTPADIEAKMRGLGLDVPAAEIINAPQAAVLHLRALGSPPCHVLADDRILPMFDEFTRDETPEVVVIGDIGARWSYAILNEAFRMIVSGAEIVAMHKGRYWQVEDGLALDIGVFVAGLEYATGKTATLVGKPAATMFRSALLDMGLDAGEVVMVGDDIHNDVAGAQAAGIRGVLVKTGKYRADLIAGSGVTPDRVIDSVASLRGYR